LPANRASRQTLDPAAKLAQGQNTQKQLLGRALGEPVHHLVLRLANESHQRLASMLLALRRLSRHHHSHREPMGGELLGLGLGQLCILATRI